MGLWNQTRGVPPTAQSFTSFSYVASFSNSFSFSVFICKNSWVIPPFQADVTSCSDHAFKVSGFPRHLLSLSSSLFPITFLLLSKTMFTSVRWFTNRYCAAQTHMCVCAQVHIQHTHTQMSFFQLNQNNSGSLLSNSSPLPFTLLPSQPLHQAKKPS